MFNRITNEEMCPMMLWLEDLRNRGCGEGSGARALAQMNDLIQTKSGVTNSV
jgi:hypothetical protein